MARRHNFQRLALLQLLSDALGNKHVERLWSHQHSHLQLILALAGIKLSQLMRQTLPCQHKVCLFVWTAKDLTDRVLPVVTCVLRRQHGLPSGNFLYLRTSVDWICIACIRRLKHVEDGHHSVDWKKTGAREQQRLECQQRNMAQLPAH